MVPGLPSGPAHLALFGGESGITTDRTALPRMFGWTFGPQLQVYYLIAFWLVISAIAMYALTRTPLGRICNAARLLDRE